MLPIGWLQAMIHKHFWIRDLLWEINEKIKIQNFTYFISYSVSRLLKPTI